MFKHGNRMRFNINTHSLPYKQIRNYGSNSSSRAKHDMASYLAGTVFSLAPFVNENIVTIIGICLLIGAMAKSSQVGLHV
ncbi:hypothetical protein HYFRA_00013630 [Hymenoscyphus fraxineus]|uniref:Uncharacterized protein n=1 Tax=Hymenoscyphus fraxineus TaxID=746836 RepID=A0A9N9LAE5_9HELO|nr:hypothetical protein HYFRA_00013630 [Hymenoscyphus fraxineus]